MVDFSDIRMLVKAIWRKMENILTASDIYNIMKWYDLIKFCVCIRPSAYVRIYVCWLPDWLSHV
jgi:hypothetical protein